MKLNRNLYLVLLLLSIGFKSSAIDLRKVTDEFKDSSYFVQQVGDSMISTLRQKIIEMTQTFQFKGTGTELTFITYEGKGCANLISGNEEFVARIKYTFVPPNQNSVFQSERISYYGCQNQLILSEVIQVEGSSQQMTADDILNVKRIFHAQPNEKRRIYRVYLDQSSNEILMIDSFRNQQDPWQRTRMTIQQTTLLAFHTWKDTGGNNFTKISKPAYQYQIQVGNSQIHVDAQSIIDYKISQLSNGIRYTINDEITSNANFNGATQDVLFRQIGGIRFGAIYNSLIDFFPASKAAPKASLLEKQLEESKVLMESKLNPDQVLKTIKDILDGVRSGKIIDNRN